MAIFKLNRSVIFIQLCSNLTLYSKWAPFKYPNLSSQMVSGAFVRIITWKL